MLLSLIPSLASTSKGKRGRRDTWWRCWLHACHIHMRAHARTHAQTVHRRSVCHACVMNPVDAPDAFEVVPWGWNTRVQACTYSRYEPGILGLPAASSSLTPSRVPLWPVENDTFRNCATSLCEPRGGERVDARVLLPACTIARPRMIQMDKQIAEPRNPRKREANTEPSSH